MAYAARSHDKLAALTSSLPKTTRCKPLVLDVTDPEAVMTAVRDIVADFGSIDIVINNVSRMDGMRKRIGRADKSLWAAS